MFDLTPCEVGRHERGDAGALFASVAGVMLGIDEGVILGAVLSLLTLIWRPSRPNIADIGKSPGAPVLVPLNFPFSGQQPGKLLTRH